MFLLYKYRIVFQFEQPRPLASTLCRVALTALRSTNVYGVEEPSWSQRLMSTICVASSFSQIWLNMQHRHCGQARPKGWISKYCSFIFSKLNQLRQERNKISQRNQSLCQNNFDLDRVDIIVNMLGRNNPLLYLFVCQSMQFANITKLSFSNCIGQNKDRISEFGFWEEMRNILLWMAVRWSRLTVYSLKQ